MTDSIVEMARGKWQALLGQWLDERALAGKHTACPICGGKDRFRLEDKDGRGNWHCTQCKGGDGFDLLQHHLGCDFRGAMDYVRHHAGKFQAQVKQPIDVEKIRLSLRRMWSEAKPLTQGDPAQQYLESRCGGTVPEAKNLRYHPSLAYRHEDGSITKHPAMIALVMAADDTPVTIHRTYLSATGKKADVPTQKKLMPAVKRVENASIRLAPPIDGWLGVAEGIETALCASIRFQVPVWSCISAVIMESWRPPAGVKMVTVFGDNDKSFTGQAAAYKLGQRLQAMTGIECNVELPARLGTDWADA